MWKSNFCKDDKYFKILKKIPEQSIPSGSKQESDSEDRKSSTNSYKHEDTQEEQNQETVIN